MVTVARSKMVNSGIHPPKSINIQKCSKKFGATMTLDHSKNLLTGEAP